MKDNKTQRTRKNVSGFIESIAGDKRRNECLLLLDLMKQVTHEEPHMWGESIIGFGNYHYRYSSGREGDWFLTGFSPRKQNLTLYIMAGFDEFTPILKRLGRFKTSKSCLYVKSLENIDLEILKNLIQESVQRLKKNT